MDNFSDYNSSLGQYHFGRPAKSRLRQAGEFVWEMAKIAIISLLIILPVRYFLIQPFYVNGASMEPNFYNHEYLIIDEISYRFREPRRGDIVVFKYPNDPKQFFIKRVVGLPGETIKIENGLVYIIIDGVSQVLAEEYLPENLETRLPISGYGQIELAADQYYLLGDNRDQSLDSRVFGPVNRDYIVGRTWLRGWPINRLTIFSAPDYHFAN